MENRPRKPLPTWKIATFVTGGMGLWILFLIFIGTRSEPISTSPEYLCSVHRNGGDTSQYFLLHASGPQTLELNGVMTNLTVQVSEVSSSEWNRNELCSNENVEDATGWKTLTSGSDCATGPAIMPCESDIKSTAGGALQVVLAPAINGRVLGSSFDLFKKGTIVKVSGNTTR